MINCISTKFSKIEFCEATKMPPLFVKEKKDAYPSNNTKQLKRLKQNFRGLKSSNLSGTFRHLEFLEILAKLNCLVVIKVVARHFSDVPLHFVQHSTHSI